jgi:reactive intermediate/imine deaminase
MSKEPIHSDQAPAAIGPYSQAVRHGTLVFLSGQIPLDPETMELIGGGIDDQVRRVLDSLQVVCTAAGGSLQQILKINVYLTDLTHFPVVNSIMNEYFDAPFPARAAVGVAALPRGAEVEMEAVMGL